MLKPCTTEISQLKALEELLVRKLLPAEAFAQWQQGEIGARFLKESANILRQLSTDYIYSNHTVHRSKEQVLAYALYLTPVNFVKVLRSLRLLDFTDNKNLRVLDFGCGPGTASLAVLSALPATTEILAVDPSIEMRSCARMLLPDRVSCTADLSVASGKYNLIICANSLNEMDDSSAQQALLKLASLLDVNGYLIILEPALKAITERTMLLRNWLLKHTALKVTYPCTRQDDCPMQNDWCHTELDWQAPGLIKQLDRLTGFNKHRLKTCLFIFSFKSSDNTRLRVVNFPEKLKNGVRLTLCGNNYYECITVPKILGKKLKNFDLVDRKDIE